jgi:phosphoribosylaminoimidazolecarboxamide formyltransferase/IMP cyclohydrolase
MKKRALFSVSDKTGVCDFARRAAALGYEIVSTGGTQKTLESAGIPVLNVSEVTGFPECLDGRLKTLHPHIHGGLLAMRGNDEHMRQMADLKIAPIDLIVINLYPFKQTIARPGVILAEAIENIDIGGPAMIRAAAKNWRDVVVVVSPSDYGFILDKLQNNTLTDDDRFGLACRVFEHTAHYDAMIAQYLLRHRQVSYPDKLTLSYEKQQPLRYGENPHQTACFYREINPDEGDLTRAEQLHGKELSFCNINDLDGAMAIVKEFAEPCVAVVKHAAPCGVGLGYTISEAWQNAYDADPVSIFGGVIAMNRECDITTAQGIGELFIEIVVAPSYSEDALSCLTQKKNIRVMRLPGLSLYTPAASYDIKKVSGGLLMQSYDTGLYKEIKRVTGTTVTEAQQTQLDFAWKVVKHVKSNAIVLVKGKRTAGIGSGQPNRIAALELALKQAGENAAGSVMASDAFFPMPDCVEAAAAAGISAIIQPGGSVKDNESIEAADKHGIAMLFTGMRHFKH